MTIQQQTERYREANREAAKICASDPVRYAGLFRELAERWLEKADEQR